MGKSTTPPATYTSAGAMPTWATRREDEEPFGILDPADITHRWIGAEAEVQDVTVRADQCVRRDGGGAGDPAEWHGGIEYVPHVYISCKDGVLTADEARQVASALIKAADVAEAGAAMSAEGMPHVDKYAEGVLPDWATGWSHQPAIGNPAWPVRRGASVDVEDDGSGPRIYPSTTNLGPDEHIDDPVFARTLAHELLDAADVLAAVQR